MVHMVRIKNVVNKIYLKPGTKGVTADWVQKELNEEMDAALLEDRKYGTITACAVEKYQTRYRITPDKICGPLTIRSLLK